MGRLIKSRKVEFFPYIRRFVPSGEKSVDSGLHNVDEIFLKVEELESMRLKDIEGLTQQECADIMGISRQTFQSIIANGRKKVTMSLIEGKPINIGGGNYSFKFCRLRCKSCNRTYDIKYMKDKNICPSCNSPKIVCKNKSKKCMDWCSG
ncbi:MAG: DUF134 domain-containing protein [Tissierellia bacterium]|nr:DUF134 domain-containing protein [Tissierellia bacterium]